MNAESITPNKDPALVNVLFAGEIVGTFDGSAITGQLVIRGFGDEDRLTIASNLSRPADLDGGPGNDTLIGSAGDDRLDGGTGNDRLKGRGGADSLFFGMGNDVLTGGAGSDILLGSDADSHWRLTGKNAGRVGSSSFNTVESLIGGTGVDIFAFTAGGKVTGTVNGGEGANTLNYATYGGPVVVNLRLGTASRTAAIANIANVVGSAVSDILVGDTAENALTGNGGRDILIGGGGLDQLSGGNGQDLQFGGATIHDTTPAALMAMRAEWRRSIAYATRISHLRGDLPGGLNAPTFLDATSVLDDAGALDLLTGGDGTDWFLLFVGDGVTDAAAGETITTL
jgi:Ca2+-binding RTX toxin-like protein